MNKQSNKYAELIFKIILSKIICILHKTENVNRWDAFQSEGIEDLNQDLLAPGSSLDNPISKYAYTPSARTKLILNKVANSPQRVRKKTTITNC